MAATSLLLRRQFSSVSTASSILNPLSPTTPLTSVQKSRLALSLLKSEKDPARISSICSAAALTPSIHLDRLALSAAVSSLSSTSPIAVRSLVRSLPLSDPRVCSHAIVLFGQAGMLDDAVRLFDEIRPPTVRVFNSLLFSCILAKRHEEVGRMYREYPRSHGIQPDLETYNLVLKSFAETGKSRSAYSILEEMGKKGVKPSLSSYNEMILGFYKEGKADEVEKVLDLMKKNGCQPKVSTYNVIIQGLCKSKKSGEANKVMERKIKKNGLKPNVVTYKHLILGFCIEGNLEEATRIFSEMGGKGGCMPDSECYFTMLHFLCKSGNFEEALRLCKQSMEKNWVPNFSTMKSLVNGLVCGSKTEEAKEIVEYVKGKFPSNAEMWKEIEENLFK